MKRVIAFMLFIMVSAIVFAQDSTGTGSGFTWSPSVLLVVSIVLGIYEVLARFIPTIRNYSVLGFIIQLIQTVFPNRSEAGKKLP